MGSSRAQHPRQTQAIASGYTGDVHSLGTIQITNRGKVLPLVLFDKGLPMEGRAVLQSLTQLTELVGDIVDGIEKQLKSPQSPA